MEAQGRSAHLIHGTGAFLVQVGDGLGIRKTLGKLVLVQRPGVDMRVDAVSGGGTIEEGLALLPPFTGGKEGRADRVDIRLRIGILRLEGGKLVVQGLRLVGQVAIDFIDDARDIGLHGGFEGLFLCRQASGIGLGILVAGGERQGSKREDAQSFHQSVHMQLVLIICG